MALYECKILQNIFSVLISGRVLQQKMMCLLVVALAGHLYHRHRTFTWKVLQTIKNNF